MHIRRPLVRHFMYFTLPALYTGFFFANLKCGLITLLMTISAGGILTTCLGEQTVTCSEKQMGDTRTSKTYISSVFCPEMFCYKLKAISAPKSWMKDPELLQKCSTGLNFQGGSDENFQWSWQTILMGLSFLLFLLFTEHRWSPHDQIHQRLYHLPCPSRQI